MSESLEAAEPAAWTHRRQKIGATLWCAFLTACLAALLFFAVFDPLLMVRDDDPPAWLADRRSGYALGFLFFWFIGSIAASLTAWLIGAREQVRNPGSSHD